MLTGWLQPGRLVASLVPTLINNEVIQELAIVSRTQQLHQERTHRTGSRGRLRRAMAGLVAMSLAIPVAIGIAAAPQAVAAPAPAYGAPTDVAANYYRALLQHTRWVDSVWDPAINAYELRDFNFAVVLGNAVLLTHGEYDEELAGISKDELRERTLSTITRYAASNRIVNPSGTWGQRLFWDTTFQSYFLVAGLLMWDDLDATTQNNLTTIATGQSTYTADLDFGNDPMSGSWTADWPTGKYQGDTAQEEVGVYTQALAPGLAWAPNHADAARWSDQFSDWMRNAAGQPTADLNNPAVIAGKAINTNTMQTIHDTYLVENHGSFGPHYQSDIWRSGGRNAIHFLLNDQPLPEIILNQPNAAELWESIKLVMSNQGEPFMPMVNDREYLYGRDVIPMAFLAQVLRDPDAARAEANLSEALEAYQTYAPVDRLTKFSGEPKYEPEARAEIAISYLLHVEATDSPEGPVEPTPQGEFFERLAGVRDFGDEPGLTVHQTAQAWSSAQHRRGFVKFPWVPSHDSWLFAISGATPFLYPRTSDTVDERSTSIYTEPRSGFEGTTSVFKIGDNYAGQATLPTGSAIYASTGAGAGDGTISVRNLNLDGYNGLDGTRTYTTADGSSTSVRPVIVPPDPADANAARIDDLEFDPVDARYVRIQGQQGHPQYGYSMYALHVYGSNDEGTDIAVGKPASASSADPSRPAATVTDGNPATRWAVASSQRTNPNSWIQVDLEAEQTISSVRLAWESSAGERYLVQTSSDGENWTTQTAFTGAEDTSAERVDKHELISDDAPDGVEARYVRMQGVQGNATYGYSMYNFRALDADGVNLAAGRPASASSQDGTHRAVAVTDGSPATRWAVSRDDRTRADSWIQVDLGSPQLVAEVHFGWESAAGRHYIIQTSLDGETWEDVLDYRYTGDIVASTSGSWINVEDKAGFVVRQGGTGITVSQEKHEIDTLHLGGGNQSFLVEMTPGNASTTQAVASAAQPTAEDSSLLVSSLDGYLTAFNLTSEDITTDVTIPYTGDTASLYLGDQTFGTNASHLEVSVPAGSSVILAPLATIQVPEAASASGSVLSVLDGRTIEISTDSSVEASGSLDVTNAETGATTTFGLARAANNPVNTFPRATPFPVEDLALSTLTFPASVLPEGMTSPSTAVDGDHSTAWIPGPDGRMITDLGGAFEIGSVRTLWDGSNTPAATVSISDDGISFRDIGTLESGTLHGIVNVDETARYVALSTEWTDGQAGITALRVLPPGVEDDAAPGPIVGDLPNLTVGKPAARSGVEAEGRPAPTYRIVNGALPAGISLNAQTGEISGTPTAAGPYVFTIEASNGVGTPTTREFTGEVTAVTTPPETPGPVDPDPDDGTDPDDNGDDGSLPTTGSNPGWIFGAALLALLMGWFARMMVRRQRLL